MVSTFASRGARSMLIPMKAVVTSSLHFCGLLADILKSECYFGIFVDRGFEIFRGNQAARSNPSTALKPQGLVGFFERPPLE